MKTLKITVFALVLCFHISSKRISGPVHTTPKKFENDIFTLKTQEIFLVHTTPEKLKETAEINCAFCICV